MKKEPILVCLFLVLFILPTVLMTDLFPFFRFSMFSEPIQRTVQTEEFVIYCHTGQDSVLLEDQLTELDATKLNALKRNYYYRNEWSAFIHKLGTLPSLSSVEYFRSYRQVYSIDHTLLNQYVIDGDR